MRTLLLVTVLLAGCSIFGPDSSTPDGQCAAAAYDDPTAKELMVKRESGNGEAQQELLPDYNDAVNRARLKCLQTKGLAPRGGVEAVRRAH